MPGIVSRFDEIVSCSGTARIASAMLARNGGTTASQAAEGRATSSARMLAGCPSRGELRRSPSEQLGRPQLPQVLAEGCGQGWRILRRDQPFEPPFLDDFGRTVRAARRDGRVPHFIASISTLPEPS